MEITIFAKRRIKEDGTRFYSYISRLTKKDGTLVTAAVKFRDECGHPKAESCPCNIVIEKENANLATRRYVREDTGEIATSYTLWVSSWEPGSEYVDNSLEDFE